MQHPLILRIFVEPNGICPTKGKRGDAGLDVYADLSKDGYIKIVNQFDLVKIPLGFRYGFFRYEPAYYDGVQVIPEKYVVISDYWLEVKNRSGVGTKSGMTEVAQVCDASYRGIPHYCAVKITPGTYTINHGDKIAQMLIHPFVDPHKISIEVVSSIEELGTTERGDTGFGGSGT